jgi:hypothetical protein
MIPFLDAHAADSKPIEQQFFAHRSQIGQKNKKRNSRQIKKGSIQY